MNYTIKNDQGNLQILLQVPQEKSQAVLDSFSQCQQGKCGCPTNQYEKLEVMNVTQKDTSIVVSLKPKAGYRLNEPEIRKCLDYTLERINF